MFVAKCVCVFLNQRALGPSPLHAPLRPNKWVGLEGLDSRTEGSLVPETLSLMDQDVGLAETCEWILVLFNILIALFRRISNGVMDCQTGKGSRIVVIAPLMLHVLLNHLVLCCNVVSLIATAVWYGMVRYGMYSSCTAEKNRSSKTDAGRKEKKAASSEGRESTELSRVHQGTVSRLFYIK